MIFQHHTLWCVSLLGSPTPYATRSPLAVWRALGLEPMSNTCLPSGDKEALSPTSQCTCAHQPYRTLSLKIP